MTKHAPVPAEIAKNKNRPSAARENQSGPAIPVAIDRLANAIAQRHPARDKILLLGIANGGIALARRLAAKIPGSRPGVLDISFHRDDIGRHPIPKEFAPTHIPGDVNNASIVLVDDVLQSGRTINAALNEVFDHGRPARVELAILVDRGGRRLPIAADYTGLRLAATETEKIRIHIDPENPSLDTLEITETAKR
ncbi:MAG: bifunctional pyr operon transcriptional regulator/uracil phosphoribosyltransferase PyrR [Opitutaceae bacterium]|jgi:pyrimidine operon attenuation protein/uracil phosphoribosyltransferase|nr:bifunctional pyr operon transcriptional regulator/uracil phosphoribosyltransferase PyrR [Opitutaceae bacterium]